MLGSAPELPLPLIIYSRAIRISHPLVPDHPLATTPSRGTPWPEGNSSPESLVKEASTPYPGDQGSVLSVPSFFTLVKPVILHALKLNHLLFL